MAYTLLLALSLVAAYGQDGNWTQLYSTGTEALNHGRYPEGRAALIPAWNLAKDFAPLDQRRALTAYSLAAVFSVQGDLSQADALLLEAKTIFEAAGASGQDKLALVLDSLGDLRVEEGLFAEGEGLLQQALGFNREKHGENDTRTAVNYWHLGNVYAVLNRPREAEDAFNKALGILRMKGSSAETALGGALEALARLYMAQSRFDEAERLIRQSLESKRQLPDQHPSRADPLLNLAVLYRMKGDSARAEPLLRKALALYEASGDLHRISALAELAGIAAAEKKYTTAERYLSQVMTLVRDKLGPGHVSIATAGIWMARIYYAQARYAQAETLVEQSLAIERRSYGDNHPEVAKCLTLLASINAKAHEAEAADLHYREAIQVYRNTVPADHPDSVAVHQAYTRFLKSGRK